MFNLFFITSLLSFLTTILSQSCSTYLNCISCTSTIFYGSLPDCKWENGNCVEDPSTPSFNDTTWYEYFTPCSSDPLSTSVMDSHTGGDRNSNKVPDTYLFYPVNGEYVPKDFYCEWNKEFSIKRGTDIYFGFYRMSRDISDKILLVFTLGSKVEKIAVTELKDRGIVARDIIKFQVFYFSYNAKKTAPFELDIYVYQSEMKKAYIIITVVIFCVIAIGLIFVLVKHIKKRIQYRNSLGGIVFSANRQSNGDNNINPNNVRNEGRNVIGRYRIGNENELEQINKVEELNEKDLVPVDYKPSINVFKDKCTICLEDFKDKEKVIVLSCKHIFHYECIKNNLINKHFKCPNCNIELKKDDVVTYKNIS